MIINRLRPSMMNLQLTLLEFVLLSRIVMSRLTLDNVNITNIIYQYSSLCGPNYAENKKTMYFPQIAEEYSMCPVCYNDNSCYIDDNCCPQQGLKYKKTKCLKAIVHLPNNMSSFGYEYEMVNTCPYGSDLSYECTKPRDIYDSIRYPPVTDRTYTSFKNQFCAMCNDIKEFIPWKIDIPCDIKYDIFSTVNDIVEKALKNNCIISFFPSNKIRNNVKKCSGHQFIETCNVTGTLDSYNKDIDFACQTLNNPFPPYKSIFCHMCNPPEKTSARMITSCNETGLWTTYARDIEKACNENVYVETTFPYKNIYCYICNTNESVIMRNKNLYTVDIPIEDVFTYNWYNEKEPVAHEWGYVHESGIRSTDVTKNCKNLYRKLKYKIDCKVPIPFNLLNHNMSNRLLSQVQSYHCNLTGNDDQYRKITLCKKDRRNLTYCEADSEFDLQWACETQSRGIIIQSEKLYYHYTVCGTHLKDFLVYDDGIQLDIEQYVKENLACDLFNCMDDRKLYPLQYILCNCCSEVWTYSPGGGTWDIFSRKYFTPNCKLNEIYDSLKQRCRQTDCFLGKQLTGDSCEQNLPTSLYSPPLSYVFPFGLTSSDIHSKITQNLQNDLNEMFSISTSICIKPKTKSSSYFVQIDILILSNTFIVDIEQRLIDYSSRLFKSSDKMNITVKYDYQSILTNENTEFENTSACVKRNRSLISNLLVCRHVLFTQREYRLSTKDNEIILDDYDAKFRFYEYHIDSEKNLRICIEDFNRIVNLDDKNDVVYLAIMITCTVISVLCLLATLITYCLFSSLKTLPGKNIMSLVFSLLVYNILYLILIIVDDTDTTVCQVIGTVIHFFLLSTFACFTMGTVHMFRIFGHDSLSSTLKANQSNYTFKIYTASAYGSAAAIVVINIIVLRINTGTFTGYGYNNKCFISNVQSFIATVLVPLVITFIINMILYSITTYKLYKKIYSKSAISAVSKTNKKEISIFIKLFTTTGCSWILLLINYFVNKTPISIAIAALNGFQGLYIFIAYIFNERIYRMYKSKIIELTAQKSQSTIMTSLPRSQQTSSENDYV
ncbi:uncharacterized protein LOC127737973 isoform X1 [Mytilus californianus]|uniref:uncharacterized protein LOC127737973 isoform X1 n=1 Tax=Mytilus californianus TaxID=6549 RepID=UPI002245370A|nr:uncharacterized protein LOC127737973 isoform X1 [Mytilus californianus]